MPDVEAVSAPRKNPWPRRLLQMLAGLAIGLVVAELGFSFRDDGAFPHVNFYAADDVLGARLRPHARERLAFGGNPTTTIGTNSLGFRTHPGGDGEWPAPADGDVLVVGDSQVFGLGVEGDQTFSAQLAKHSDRTVLNAGVPTYGPQEYAAVVDEVLKTRKVKRVVFVVNMANDLFELSHTNLKRHVIWDGWAVRKETAPTTLPTSWPGRQWLFSQSHLVFAARAGLLALEGKGIALDSEAKLEQERTSSSLPSEGTWTDLVRNSSDVVTRRSRAQAQEQAQAQAPGPRRTAIDTVLGIEDAIIRHEYDHRYYDEAREGADAVIAEATAIAARAGRPDDIVVREYAETGREIAETASALLAGAIVKRRTYEALRVAATTKKDAALLKLLDDHKAARAAIDDAARSSPTTPALSPLAIVLQQVRRRCDEVGAKLIVVALPLDVMVSAEEWKKYGAPARDMSATQVLTEEVLADADAAGAIGVDVTRALSAAEPGAFLDRDLHMSARGHEAVATVLAGRLDELPRLREPLPGLPAGRSAVPTAWEWSQVTERAVKGSSAAGCETKQIREWLKVACLKNTSRTPTGAQVMSGGEGDAHTIAVGDAAVLLAPVLPGKHIQTRFFWQAQRQDLVIDWPAGADAATIAFGPVLPRQAPPVVSAETRALVKTLCPDGACGTTYGAVDEGCRRFNHAKCTREGVGCHVEAHYFTPACLQMEPGALPNCAEGFVPALATLRCRRPCDVDRPCGADQVCHPWQGASVCIDTRAVAEATSP